LRRILDSEEGRPSRVAATTPLQFKKLHSQPGVRDPGKNVRKIRTQMRMMQKRVSIAIDVHRAPLRTG